MPIDLHTLIPEYWQKLPPNQMQELYSRFNILLADIQQIDQLHDKTAELVKDMKLLANVSNLIEAGFEPIEETKKVVGSIDPAVAKPLKEKIGLVLKWYIYLNAEWEKVLQTNIS